MSDLSAADEVGAFSETKRGALAADSSSETLRDSQWVPIVTSSRPVDPAYERRGLEGDAGGVDLRVYYEVATALGSEAPCEEAVREALKSIGKGLGWHLGVLFEAEDLDEVLRPTVIWRAPGTELAIGGPPPAELRLRRGEGLPGRVWRERVPLYQQDANLGAGTGRPLRLAGNEMRSVMSFPVATARAVYGVVAMFSRDVQPPSANGRETWSALGGQLGMFYERQRTVRALARAEARLREQVEVAERTGSRLDELMARRRVEEELLASKARFQTLFESNIVGVIVADFKGRITEANDEYLRIVGYSRAEFEQGLVEWRKLTPADWIGADEAAIERLRRTNFCDPYRKEYLRRDGVRVPVIIRAALLDRGSGESVCFVQDDTPRREAEGMLEAVKLDVERRVRERTATLEASKARAGEAVSELTRSESRLRTLAVYLQRIREEERAQLAREIHDVLGQELTGLKMDAAWVMRRLRQPELPRDAVVGRLTMMERSIDSAITTVRRIATDLRPGVLDDLGLVSALEWQAREYERRSGLTVTFTAPSEELSVDRAPATALFRIFQELLTNIARHAQARSVEVELVSTEQRLVLQVRDDGRGISQEELSASQSLGLLGMRERATALGGTCSIAGQPGLGTVARVELPREAPAI